MSNEPLHLHFQKVSFSFLHVFPFQSRENDEHTYTQIGIPVRFGRDDISRLGRVFPLGATPVEKFDGLPGNRFQQRLPAPPTLTERPLIRFTDHNHPRQGLIEFMTVHRWRNHR